MIAPVNPRTIGSFGRLFTNPDLASGGKGNRIKDHIETIRGGVGRFGERAGQLSEEAAGIYNDIGGLRESQKITAESFDPTQTSYVGAGIGILNGGVGLATVGVDILPMVALGVPSGALAFTGGAANKLGLTGLGGSLQGASEKVNRPLNFFRDAEIGSLNIGNKAAGVMHNISDVFYAFTKRVNNLTGYFTWQGTRAANKSALAFAKANTHLAQLHGAPQELVSSAHGLLAAARVSPEAFEDASKAFAELQKTHNSSGNLAKTIRGFTKHIGIAHNSHMKMLDAHGLASGTHNTAETVKKLGLQSGISRGLWGASSVTSMALSAHETMSDLKAFRSMLADMQGKKIEQVTSGDAMFSELPHAGNIARQALIKAAGPKAVLEAVNAVFNIKVMRGMHVNPLLFFAPMVGSQAISMLTGGNILDVYKEMKTNDAHGKENSAAQYAQLIGLAHKELYKRGGGDSQFAQELGEMYASRHASVRDTLQAVASGQVEKELQDIRLMHDQAEAARETSALASTAGSPSVHMSEVASVSPNQMALAQHKQPIALQPHENFASRIAQPSQTPEAVR